MYDLAILGGGPAAMTAGLYAVRKNLTTLMIARDIGGQLLLTNEIENWIGIKHISGFELNRKFEDHLSSVNGIKRKIGVTVTDLTRSEGIFRITADASNYESRAVILATGKRSRPLDVPGEKELAGRGISYCATCDAPLYTGRNVAVVGGGNSAVQAVIDLQPIAESITLINIMPDLQADGVLIDRMRESGDVKILTGSRINAVNGEKRVESVTVEHLDSGETKDMEVQGVFVEIGLIPNSDFVDGTVERNAHGEVIVDCLSRTNVAGVFAAGDVTTVPAKQIIVAAGEGAKAALSAYDYLVMNGFWSIRAGKRSD
jgi:alkyl hydroperoxide reductase subunit F